MKKALALLMGVCLLAAVSGTASATLSWQTAPLLGYTVTKVDCVGAGDTDLFVETRVGPYGGLYVPHYSEVGDPYYGVGGPGVTVFVIDPDTYEAGHWTDKVVSIAAGSGVNVDLDHTYDWNRTWSYLGVLQAPYSISYGGVYTATATFVMLGGPAAKYVPGKEISDLWAEDVGDWKLVETWTDRAGGSISFERDFEVKLVPEPLTMLGMFLGVGSVGAYIRKRRMA